MEAIIENIALAVFILCFGLSLVRAFKVRTRPWVILASGFGCNMLAQAYWVGYIMVFGETPAYFYISDIGWAADFLFILMVLIECNIKLSPTPPTPAAWIPVVISAVLCVYYIAIGNSVVACVVDNGLMASIGYFAVRGVAHASGGKEASRQFRNNRAFAAMCLAFVVIELCLWTASCFYSEVPALYDLFNYALFASHAGLLACAWRSEDI
ncbi:MAG: hypothetical protein Q4C36_08015 [Coriobacteriia bacterium]|nr:hypothetical protein [Coriobacteriia bacterium]